jgi:calcineurin-like phosphoesterase family protein
MKEQKFEFSAKNTFFTSDTHFGHANIIRLCNRPFKDVEEMNEKLVENWNRVVPEDGTVFHLGDFAFGGSALWNSIIPRLNGQIYLIIGNHDRKNLRQGYMDKFVGVLPQMQIQIEKRSIYLNHYPFLCYGGSYRNDADAVWQLFGHVHSGPTSSGLDCGRLVHLFPYQYDVGVDNNNYTPISWTEVKEKIQHQIDEGVEKSVKEHTIPDEVYKLSD